MPWPREFTGPVRIGVGPASPPLRPAAGTILPMDAVVDFLRRLPVEIGRAGGSVAWRAGLFAAALLLNIGFYLPSLPEGTPGAGVPGVHRGGHPVVSALRVFAA